MNPSPSHCPATGQLLVSCFTAAVPGAAAPPESRSCTLPAHHQTVSDKLLSASIYVCDVGTIAMQTAVTLLGAQAEWV